MSDTFKSYFSRNLKKVIAQFGDVALLDEIAEANLASALATKINGKADSSTVSTLSGKIDTLVGSTSGDDAKSVRTISAEEVAKIVADAPTSYDTLKEIADWISSHADSASAMNSAIVALQAKALLGSYSPGTYTLTEDTEAVANKKYYTRSGESPDYTYTEVTGLTAGDDISSAGYYEADEPVEYATVKAYVEAYVAAQLNANIPNISVASATGAGNVITGLSYSNGTFTPEKAITAITTADLVDLTDEEVAALFVPDTPAAGD